MPGETGAAQGGIFVAAGATSTTITECTIGGNNGDGIVIIGATTVTSSTIGLRADGTTIAANAQHGIHVVGPAHIGPYNVISGNGVDGIHSSLSTPAMGGANGPAIDGNRIGTNRDGIAARPNGRHGVFMNGDHTALSYNVISGNGQHGVYSDLPDRPLHAVLTGNTIGLGSDRFATVPNGVDGIHIASNAITIGGLPAARNFISGNTRSGIRITAGEGHTIQGNYIGTELNGVADRGNGAEGIYCAGRATIGGGVVTGEGNLVSGNDGQAGIAIIHPGWASIRGNFVGVDRTGATALPNAGDGIVVTSSDPAGVEIGSGDPGARNLIAGNGGNGITVTGANARIAGNRIGVDFLGHTPMPNGGDGVSVTGANVTIGGTTADASNHISGNSGAGVRIVSAANVTVQGNSIGTDVQGFLAFPNAGGIVISGSAASFATIRNNHISGNSGHGIEMSAANTTGIRIEGNRIGTHIDGIMPLPNSGSGIVFTGAGSSGNFIGGLASGAGNNISFNDVSGITHNISSGTTIAGNTIRASGAGISMASSSGNHLEGNTIRQHATYGIAISGGTGNRITRNSIYANTALGIDLLPPSGVNPNDALDADSGGNQLQNYPVLTGAYRYPGPAGRVTGTLHSAPGSTFTLEFFSSASGDPEGRTYLGNATVTTDGGGDAAFDVTLATAPAAGDVVTATATDAANNTSEFSAAVTVTEPGVLTLDRASHAVAEDGGTFAVTVNRSGGSEGTVTVSWGTGGGTANPYFDYEPGGGTLTFAPGVTSQTVNVTILDDAFSESSETFHLELANPSGGAVLGTPSLMTVTILDNETAPSVSVAGGSSGESPTGSITFQVTLSAASGQAVTVDYATSDGTATAGADYTATSGTLTFAPGEQTLFVLVPVTADALYEGDETVIVTLTNPSNASIADATATGTIVEDDSPATADLSIAKTGPAAVGPHVPFQYTITVSNGGPQAATNVVVTDALPPSLTFVSATPSQGTCSGTTTITCNLGTIANAGTATIALTVSSTATSGTVTNTATVTAAEADPNPTNDSATAAPAAVLGAAVPTLSEWMLVLLVMALGIVALRRC
ncbi:MAG TPA: IPTL-CTERM sorting domain-containing protein [Thermoanaerobaculia bacterium]